MVCMIRQGWYTPYVPLSDDERAAHRAASKAKWQAANAESVNAKTRRWYYKNQDQQRVRLKTYARERRVTDPLTVRSQATAYRRQRRQEMIDAYGGCCACCGEREFAFLTLDHINGDGAADRRSHMRNPSSHAQQAPAHAQDAIVRELRAAGWPKDGRFRILCWNCQWGWRRPEGCPNQATTCLRTDDTDSGGSVA